jgi:Flp pilus assembly protein TadG
MASLIHFFRPAGAVPVRVLSRVPSCVPSRVPEEQAAKPRLTPLVRNESGSELVEFALSAGIVLMFILGIVEASLLLYTEHFVTNAARDASRYAMVRGSSWNPTACAAALSYSCVASNANVTQFVENSLPGGIDVTKLNVTTSWLGFTPANEPCDTVNGKNSPSCAVKVTVSYKFNLFVPYIPLTTVVLSSTSIAAISE